MANGSPDSSTFLGPSPLALGIMRILDWGHGPTDLAAFLNQAAEAGLGVLDTADIYGGGAAEPALGTALRIEPGLRDHFRIVGKCGIRLRGGSPPVRIKHYDTSRRHLITQVEGTLRHLGTDRLDLLLLHRPDPLLDAPEVAEAVQALIREGKLLAFGVSNFQPAQTDLLQSRLAVPLAANQIEASLWHPEPLLDGTVDHAQRTGLRVMAWSPLGGGRAAAPGLQAALEAAGRELGLGPAQVALAWLGTHPAGILPVLGTGRIQRVREAVAALGVRLDRETWFGLLEAARGVPVP